MGMISEMFGALLALVVCIGLLALCLIGLLSLMVYFDEVEQLSPQRVDCNEQGGEFRFMIEDEGLSASCGFRDHSCVYHSMDGWNCTRGVYLIKALEISNEN